jgi:hypothetical protein
MARINDVAAGLRSSLGRLSGPRARCAVALLVALASCGGPPFNSYDPPPGFAIRITTAYPDAQARYVGSRYRGERVIDLTDDPTFSPLGTIYSFLGWVYWGKWTTFDGTRWPATWMFFTLAGCGEGTNFSGDIRHKLIETTCVPKTPGTTSLSPNSYSADNPPAVLTLSFDSVPSGTAAAVYVVDGAATTVIQGYDTTVWDGHAQVPTPSLSPGSYKVLIEFDQVSGIDGGYADLTVSGSAAATYVYGGQSLNPEGSVSSPNGRFVLKYQNDGNLVLYDNGGAAWAINCWPECNGTGFGGNPFQPAGYATMQSDGNFVVYNAYGNPVWHTWTYGNPGAYLAIKDDGGLVVYSSGGTQLWSR